MISIGVHSDNVGEVETSRPVGKGGADKELHGAPQ